MFIPGPRNPSINGTLNPFVNGTINPTINGTRCHRLQHSSDLGIEPIAGDHFRRP